MSKNQSKLTKKPNAFVTFLKSLCSNGSNGNKKQQMKSQSQKSKVKSKRKINKTPRLTFHFDRVLVKVSRKNIVQEQFMENQILTFHLQKYLAARLKQQGIVLFCGDFSSYITEKIPFSMQLKTNMQQAFESNNNYVLNNYPTNFKLKPNSLDTLVVQLYYGQNYSNASNNSDNQKNNKLDTEQEQQTIGKTFSNLSLANVELVNQINKIQIILKNFHNVANNFVFICDKELRLENVHNIFLVFRQSYLFQFQRVKKLQKIVCNIIYISKKSEFLKIDNLSLRDFIINQLEKINAFSGDLEQFEIKNKTKSQQNKKALNSLLLQLLELNLHIDLTQILSLIIERNILKNSNKQIINQFVYLIYKRCPDSRPLIEKYKEFKLEQIKQENKQAQYVSSPLIKSFDYEGTPIFQMKKTDSEIFPKINLFKSHQWGQQIDQKNQIIFDNEESSNQSDQS